ncbi:MAG TPA: hypothetical protein VJR58_14775 [Vineibacter sp.]|nr:hypothetical protein [Vineibacter sp.]
MALETELAAWGDFAPDWQHKLAERIGPAREGLSGLVSAWAETLADGDGRLSPDALRAAFLAIDGARRWPTQFLAIRPDDAFRAELYQAVPQPLPSAAPLDMPEQPL